jgi:prolyl-tRNA synthetase
MRYSKLFGKTVKSVSSDMKAASHKLLYKAGFVRESSAGRYYFLPLGIRVRNKIIEVVRDEMNKAGGQELITPVLHPLELWKETNRTDSVGFELMTIKDRRGAEFALGGTAEEMMVALVRQFQLSYKDFPFNIYQFSQKFRDELRARGGLLRVREFLMKDAYSFHTNEDDFKKEYQNMWDTYLNIFHRLGLSPVVVEADNGYIGGDYCHEFQQICDAGEDKLFYVKSIDKYFNKEIAPSKAPEVSYEDKEKLPKEDILGEGIIGVDELSEFLKISVEKTTKTILFIADKKRYIAVAVRGGYDIDETKVKRVVKADTLELAEEETIQKLTGAEIGYLGPLNLPKDVEMYFDESTDNRINFECGANKTNYHTINVNWDRDIDKPDKFYDLKETREGDIYPETGEKYEVFSGAEIGNIFQLGYHYSKKMKDAVFTDIEGNKKEFYMGCYGIGIGRTMAVVVEAHHDENGIIWPKSIAPFDVHLVSLGSIEDESYKIASNLAGELEEKGIEVLWDDRADVQAGEKFADADLIGIPIRIVVSERSLKNGGVEVKKRSEKESEIIALDKILEFLNAEK